jgi:hypothetical protein
LYYLEIEQVCEAGKQASPKFDPELRISLALDGAEQTLNNQADAPLS